MTNIYVGNLPYTTSETELQQSFEAYGAVARTKVIMDRDTGKSRGFGFVEMTNDEEAKAAIAALDGKDLEGRSVKVNEAKPRRNDDSGGGAAYRY